MGEATLLLSEPLSVNQGRLQTNSIAEYRFNKGNLLIGNMQNDHTFLGQQSHSAMPSTTNTPIWFLLRVEGWAEVVRAAAVFEDGQIPYLPGQFRLACLGGESLKLGGELREHVGEPWAVFVEHWMS